MDISIRVLLIAGIFSLIGYGAYLLIQGEVATPTWWGVVLLVLLISLVLSLVLDPPISSN